MVDILATSGVTCLGVCCEVLLGVITGGNRVSISQEEKKSKFFQLQTNLLQILLSKYYCIYPCIYRSHV